MQKKAEVATDITTIKNDYVSNASLTSRLNKLKSQHIATEVKTIDDKTKKNSSDILGLEGRLKQKEDTINENERGPSFNRGFFYYLQKSKFVYECKFGSFDSANSKKISKWKSTSIFNYAIGTNMIAVKNASGELPEIGVYDDLYVHLSGSHFKHEIELDANNLKINVYCVYELDPNHPVEIILLLCKMLYLDQCKLLKMLIIVSLNIKDMVFVLMKVVCLA